MEINVSNLPANIKETTLLKLFGKFGKVAKIKMVRDRESGTFKGRAYVTMPVKSEALKAVDRLHDTMLEEMNIQVTLAKPKTTFAKRGKSNNRQKRLF
jgi:RNA recognition motif-containing protein